MESLLRDGAYGVRRASRAGIPFVISVVTFKWKPRKGFDPKDPSGSLREKVEEWQLKLNLSRVLWGDMEALKSAQEVRP